VEFLHVILIRLKGINYSFTLSKLANFVGGLHVQLHDQSINDGILFLPQQMCHL